MSRMEQIGDCTLYLGDCLDILPTLPGGADAVVCDPPYKMEIHGRGFAAKRDYYERLDYGISVTFELSPSFYRMLLDLLSETNMVFFCNKLMKLDIENWAVAQKFTFDELVLLKSTPAPLTNNQWLPDKEFAVHIFKNCKVKGDYKTKRSWFADTNYQQKDVDHPSVKPTYILEHVVNNVTDRGGVVLDPFMGSGTTGVACCRTGRKFIGIEINPHYFDVACRRIESESKQRDLFIAASPKVRHPQEKFL